MAPVTYRSRFVGADDVSLELASVVHHGIVAAVPDLDVDKPFLPCRDALIRSIWLLSVLVKPS